jgi:hypothetical protein
MFSLTAGTIGTTWCCIGNSVVKDQELRTDEVPPPAPPLFIPFFVLLLLLLLLL